MPFIIYSLEENFDRGYRRIEMDLNYGINILHFLTSSQVIVLVNIYIFNCSNFEM